MERDLEGIQGNGWRGLQHPNLQGFIADKTLFPEIRRQRDLVMLGDGGVWKMLRCACGCEQKKRANERESVSHILSDGNLQNDRWSQPDYVSSGVDTNRAGMRFEVSQGIRRRITLESLQHLRIARQFFRRRNFRAT